MVSAPDLEGDPGHVAEVWQHNLPAGNFPLHQAAQEQIRSESRTAEETGAISKASRSSEKLNARLQALEKVLVRDSSEVAREYDRKHSQLKKKTNRI